jgi:stage V sporulation protein R
MSLTPDLVELREQIKAYAIGYGLDFFETVFELVDFEQMNMVAAYGGFPNRYPHWKFGMEYEQLSKSYEYGLHKIYELVINNDPSYAYLLEGNAYVDQKLVMAHVYGHVDFFKNNFMFAHTNRRMIDEMANHGTRSRRHIEKYGHDRVENFIDMCLSIDNLIDYQSPYIQRRPRPGAPKDDVIQHDVPKLKVMKPYMQDFINPKDFLESQKKKLDEQKKLEKRFPEHKERDVMLFLLEHAPLEAWEQDSVAMLREEAYYFAPQGQTKIMNEGWASFWHSTIMTQKALSASEFIDYADHHAGTMAVQPGKLNPYKLGLELWRDIEDRWNRGRFGKEYDECDDYAQRKHWDKQLGLGRKKIFEVRKHYNDVTFIDEFLTMDFVRENKMFVYMFNRKSQNWEITDRDFRRVKQKLLDNLTNFGQPIIRVVDGNFHNRSELLLEHEHDGVDLRMDYAREVLRNVYNFWKRPVGVATRIDDRGVILRFDGTDFDEQKYEKL